MSRYPPEGQSPETTRQQLMGQSRKARESSIARLKAELLADLLAYSASYGWMTDEDTHLMIHLMRERPAEINSERA